MNNPYNQSEIVQFIRANPVAVLGTIGEKDIPYGAAVYVYPLTYDKLYFVTKSKTRKSQNILRHPNVSLTIVNPAEDSSLQASGIAREEENLQTIALVMERLTEIHARGPETLPPISKLRAGAYQVFCVRLDHVKLAQYLGEAIGSSEIFKEE